MFNVSTLRLDNVFKAVTPLTNGVIDETQRQFAPPGQLHDAPHPDTDSDSPDTPTGTSLRPTCAISCIVIPVASEDVGVGVVERGLIQANMTILVFS